MCEPPTHLPYRNVMDSGKSTTDIKFIGNDFLLAELQTSLSHHHF